MKIIFKQLSESTSIQRRRTNLPQPVRDGYSKALIFIPTKEEHLYLEGRKALEQELSEVRDLKEQLKELIKKAKE